MSALGHKRTFETYLQNVRFTPESGHYSALHQMSAFSQKRTLRIWTADVLRPIT